MASDSTSFRLAIKITDESFDVSKLGQYNLYYSVGKFNIRVGVADVERNKFILLEDYELTNFYTPLQIAQQWQEIIQNHEAFNRPDWAVIRIGIKNQKFTLIPATLFDKQAAEAYLQMNCDLDNKHDVVFSYRHAGLELENVFALDRPLQEAVKAVYATKPVHFLHHTSALTEGLLHYGEIKADRKLYVFVDKNSLNILVMQGRNLQFSNQFQYTTPEDFMYFLIFAMQEQNLNPDADAVTIWGDLTHDSSLFTLMRKYIRNIQFGGRPGGVHYSYKLEDQFEHRFLDVYSLHFCE